MICKNFATQVVLLGNFFPTVFSRPEHLQEQNEGYWTNIYRGSIVGWETVKALLTEEETDYLYDDYEYHPTTLQIVGLGLGRTGTTSIVIALEILGYSVIHDDEHTELTDIYAALEREEIDIDDFHLLAAKRGYNATFKTADYEWVVEHPEIKAILTVRDNPDQYVDSWLVAAPFVRVLGQRPFCWMPTVQALMPSFEAEFKGETTNWEPELYLDRETLRDNYIDYVEDVQESIPPERLLTFNVKQGWEPLCKYLGKPIPDMPFPHVHTRSKLHGEMYFYEVITWIWPLAFILPMVLIVMIGKTILSKFSGSQRKVKYQ